MNPSPISESVFEGFRQLMANATGIKLADTKKTLVVTRLAKRLAANNLDCYGDYLNLINRENCEERQVAINLLTTNETYFFREEKHFNFLEGLVTRVTTDRECFRVWSAACSSGQEAYSAAMVISSNLRTRPWEILATDISTDVLHRAKQAIYPIAEANKIPSHYLRKYALKGIDLHEGSMSVVNELKNRVRFTQMNLCAQLPEMPQFDVIFLRNVMIYFDLETKKQVVARLKKQIKPDGYLFVGHSESLNGIDDSLRMVMPSIYQLV